MKTCPPHLHTASVAVVFSYQPFVSSMMLAHGCGLSLQVKNLTSLRLRHDPRASTRDGCASNPTLSSRTRPHGRSLPSL